MVMGPQVRSNRTPMEGAFACMADKLVEHHKPLLTIAVGDVKDYTGAYNINEGNAMSQGGALMVYSALGKLGATVRIAERFDTRIAEMELGYIDHRQLGDGHIHTLDPAGKNVVPWLPYFGGSILKSDYYIVGGITELNYNIQSGGGLAQVNQVGPDARVYTESVAIDLRIVNSRNLTVVRTVSFEKQLTGEEVNFNIFRFFGSSLFDVDIGNKQQEPAQLGVRTALEEGVLKLVGTVEGISAKPCIDNIPYMIPKKAADELRTHPDVAPSAEPVVPVAAPGTAQQGTAQPVQDVGQVQNNGSDGVGQEGFKVAFDYGSTELPGASLTNMDRIAALSKKAAVHVMLLARDTENWDPGRRDQLIADRVRAVTQALVQRGVPLGAVMLDWKPAASETGITRDGAGFQIIAKLHVQQ